MEAALGRAVSATRCWAAGDPVADTPPQGRVQQSETEEQTAGCLPIKFFSNLDHRKYYYSDAPEERTEPRLVRSQAKTEDLTGCSENLAQPNKERFFYK
ncbi:hypothetical protein CapIbe_017937 [Capra ibex]